MNKWADKLASAFVQGFGRTLGYFFARVVVAHPLAFIGVLLIIAAIIFGPVLIQMASNAGSGL